MSVKNEILIQLSKLGNYSRLPKRLEEKYNLKTNSIKEDEFGAEPRIKLMQELFSGKKFNSLVDIGGNNGFFSLQLIDDSIASKSTIFDVNDSALSFGKKIASELNLTDKSEFIKKEINLSSINDLPNSDMVFCLNLIHHAGVLFDVEIVKKIGWEKYSEEFLSILRKKYKSAVIGVGFKGLKPINWFVPKILRPITFYNIIKSSGWEIAYDANINELLRLGSIKANHKRTKSNFSIIFVKIVMKIFGFKISNFLSSVIDKIIRKKNKHQKLEKYHIYFLE
jgi:hypothetical protein